MTSKDVILGMGEVGSTLFELLSSTTQLIGNDIDPKKCKINYPEDEYPYDLYFLHVCIPYTNDFFHFFDEAAGKYKPKAIIIHSTVPPGTASKIQAVYDIPIISAPTRGVHRRFLEDMKRYTKFYSYDEKFFGDETIFEFEKRLHNAGLKCEVMPTTTTCELAKILTDTTYYGWLITYAQITKLICDKYGVDYDEMWKFAKEIQEYLGNRPKMYPGFIGGHCVMPNLELIEGNHHFDTVKGIMRSINLFYE